MLAHLIKKITKGIQIIFLEINSIHLKSKINNFF